MISQNEKIRFSNASTSNASKAELIQFSLLTLTYMFFVLYANIFLDTHLLQVLNKISNFATYYTENK